MLGGPIIFGGGPMGPQLGSKGGGPLYLGPEGPGAQLGGRGGGGPS